MASWLSVLDVPFIQKIGRPRKETCIRGHDITDPKNYYLRGDDNGRRCMTCKRITQRIWRNKRSRNG